MKNRKKLGILLICLIVVRPVGSYPAFLHGVILSAIILINVALVPADENATDARGVPASGLQLHFAVVAVLAIGVVTESGVSVAFGVVVQVAEVERIVVIASEKVGLQRSVSANVNPLL